MSGPGRLAAIILVSGVQALFTGSGRADPVPHDQIVACAVGIEPEMVRQVIAVESHGNPLALNVNGTALARAPRDAADAAALARDYIRAGYTVDMGLMQVNSANLVKLGYSVEDMFDPCRNLRAGSTVLAGFHALARQQYPDAQGAKLAALSAYNTGSFTLGFTNGYVARYTGSTGRPVRLIRDGTPGGEADPPDPYTATTVVFMRPGDLPAGRERDPHATGIIVGGQPTAPTKEEPNP